MNQISDGPRYEGAVRLVEKHAGNHLGCLKMGLDADERTLLVARGLMQFPDPEPPKVKRESRPPDPNIALALKAWISLHKRGKDFHGCINRLAREHGCHKQSLHNAVIRWKKKHAKTK